MDGAMLGPSRGLRRWLTEVWTAESSAASLGSVIRWTRGWLLDRSSRTFVRILVIALAIQFALAPLTSWSGDTSAFVGSAVALLYRGSPYATNQFFDPPLGPFLEAPFFALISIWATPQSLLVSVPGIAPASSVAGVSTQIPTTAALLALKTPLLLSVDFSGFCVLYLAELIAGRKAAPWVAGAWLLNPLVIWSSAVHGEVDVLAAAAVLAFAVAVIQRWYLLAGWSLGLGIMAKAYPIALLPMAFVLLNAHNRPPDERGGSATLARFALGLGLGVAPFILFLPNLEQVYAGVSAFSGYGGFNALLLFNSGVFLYGPQISSGVFSQTTAALLHAIFVGLFVAALVGSLALAYLETYLPPKSADRGPSKAFVYALVWPTAGVLLYQTSPQSENLVLLVALGVLLTCFAGRLVRVLLWTLTAAGVMLYFSLATPFAYFYPLGRLAGPGSIVWINTQVIRYRTTPLIHYQDLWVVAGLLGAACVLSFWTLALKQLVIEIRSRGFTKPGTAT